MTLDAVRNEPLVNCGIFSVDIIGMSEVYLAQQHVQLNVNLGKHLPTGIGGSFGNFRHITHCGIKGSNFRTVKHLLPV